MRCIYHLFSVTVILCFVSIPSSRGYENDISKPFPLGIIGCLVSDVCGPDELCENDKLFGSCQSVNNFNLGINYDLTTPELDQMGAELSELRSRGFSWHDAFTQCIVQNTILAFAKRQSINLEAYCDYVLAQPESDWTQATKNEIATVLEKLLEASELQQDPEFESDADDWNALRSNSDKRDEIVEVHKYFDKSSGLKRNTFTGLEYSPDSYLNNRNSPDFNENSERLDDNVFGSPGQIKAYLRALEQLSRSAKQQTLDNEANNNDNVKVQDIETGMEGSMITGQQHNPESASTIVNSETEDSNKEKELANVADNSKFLTITPPDEKALEDLMAGNVDPHDLEVDQLKRLMKIVEIMVQQLDDQDKSSSSDLLNIEETLENPQVLADTSADAIDTNQGEVIPDPDTEREVIPADIPNNIVDLDKKTVELEPKEAVQDVELKDREVESKPLKDDRVDMRYAYIKVDKYITVSEGGAFLETFANIIKLPATSLADVMIWGDKITFEVLPNPYYNASMVANEADNADVIDKLEKMTGMKIIKSGIGKKNQVEVKKNDNKYVVLTFILVGCIAGILLAVVVIYLIKRQSRSKEKLAELAENVEGTESSKDYQDLCRQRMQSKSSEKPEPLHAASQRIGSVSDNVRSPSSRSSTSSWSEEPVQTNMDISTGHIVLSYMEDHLNNQDRLDKEWEALSSYEAEPCNTKIATDASNMRKNRYGDILPYDHSRVVLASAANVSSSDYINANFITDHDPRNPAFIVGQGPLPHTVADFWQMVWEQGSVVIVMLTKLTENGTAMCHRYWPEEGSDLYHIYEVHLVSEHIWCDDYLVRSFYLKNLQTNETRTVTQFHFITWPNLDVPGSIKALLDFRRKVNKSYRGRSCPIVVHCSDGCDRSGTYILIDMVLNRMSKGAKEIDMAATLEHIRDQRMSMVKSKEQFQFALGAVAEEVHAILKALPQ